MEPFLLITVMIWGALSLPIFPICLELGVEITYPHSPAVSTGLQLMTGQTLGVLYILLTTSMAQNPTKKIMNVQTCTTGSREHVGVYDWQYSMLVWNLLVVLRAIFFVTMFWPKYRRIEYERNEQRNRKIQSDQELQLMNEEFTAVRGKQEDQQLKEEKSDKSVDISAILS